MEKRLILFDFDGTIADSFPVLLSFAKREGLLPEGEDPESFRDLHAKDLLRKAGIPWWKLPFMTFGFHGHFAASASEIGLIDGMAEVIRRLHEEGFALGIVTTNSRENAVRILEREGLMPYFSSIVGNRNLFGKAAVLKRVVAGHGTDPGAVWYVGDEVRDAEAARDAGLRFAAVSWGYNSTKAFRAAEPDLSVSTPRELVSFFLSAGAPER